MTLRKNWKAAGLLIIVGVAAFAYLNHFVLKPWGIGCGQEQPLEDTWTERLTEAGYIEAEDTRPSHIPGDKEKPITESGSKPVFYAEGEVVVDEDTLTVEAIGVQAPDGSRWFQAWVDGQRVRFNILEWQKQPVEKVSRDFSGFVAVAWVNEQPDIAVGVAWQPIGSESLRGGVSVVTDLNETITTAPQWIAPCARFSASYGDVIEGGVDLGYRFGQDRGFHVDFGVGIRF